MAKKQLIIDADIPVQQKVLGLIACIAQENSVEITAKLKPSGLSFQQLMLLHALAHSPEKSLTVNQLKAQMLDDSPNVSRALNKLVDKGFIEKQRSDKDQRTVFIAITAAGEQAHIDGDKRLGPVTLKLSEQEAQSLYQLLLKIS